MVMEPSAMASITSPARQANWSARAGVGAQAGPGQEHRTGGIEPLRIERGHRPARGTEQGQRAAHRKAGQAGLEGGGAHPVVHRGDPAVAQPLDGGAELLGVLRVLQHLDRTGLPGQFGLLGVDAVVITLVPRLVAHWVRIRPTPPAPACTRIVSSDCTAYTDFSR